MQAYRLHQALTEVIERRDEWREKDKESPQQERERLLGQVKADNQEIASLEKRYTCVVTSYPPQLLIVPLCRSGEQTERLSVLQERLSQADSDL